MACVCHCTLQAQECQWPDLLRPAAADHALLAASLLMTAVAPYLWWVYRPDTQAGASFLASSTRAAELPGGGSSTSSLTTTLLDLLPQPPSLGDLTVVDLALDCRTECAMSTERPAMTATTARALRAHFQFSCAAASCYCTSIAIKT
jgi:hypothetical protein